MRRRISFDPKILPIIFEICPPIVSMFVGEAEGRVVSVALRGGEQMGKRGAQLNTTQMRRLEIRLNGS